MLIKILSFTIISFCFLGVITNYSYALESPSVLYVPLIGITSVPKPMTLTSGPANVTFSYAVKNFLREAALTNVKVIDDTCSPVKFINGDDNRNNKLDYDETWRYTCTIKLSQTTQSTAIVSASANYINATQKTHATVVVGNETPPLVSIINITKVAYPLSLSAKGGDVTFTYKVNNPGDVPLEKVSVTDDKCPNMSNKLGDTNGNELLDINEVWIYNCTTKLFQTTTSKASVTAFANSQRATGDASITVTVKSLDSASSSFINMADSLSKKILAWKVLTGLLIILIIFMFMIRNKKTNNIKRYKSQK